MNERFEVGEIAIAVGWSVVPQYNGEEVLVVRPLRVRAAPHLRTGRMVTRPCYVVRCADGREFSPRPQSLKKKRPPREDLQIVRWADCPWQPEKAHA